MKVASNVMKGGKHFQVVESDVRASDDKDNAGLTPAESSNFLSWRLIMKYFLMSFSPFC